MPILALVVIGAAAGLIATRLVKVETDLITTIVIGILGAILAGTVLRVLIALTGSPASWRMSSCSGPSAFSAFFCFGVAGTSIRS